MSDLRTQQLREAIAAGKVGTLEKLFYRTASFRLACRSCLAIRATSEEQTQADMAGQRERGER